MDNDFNYVKRRRARLGTNMTIDLPKITVQRNFKTEILMNLRLCLTRLETGDVVIEWHGLMMMQQLLSYLLTILMQ